MPKGSQCYKRTSSHRTQETLTDILNMEPYPAITKCGTPCTVTRSKILSKGQKKKALHPSILILKFDEVVVHKTKVLAYRFSNFVIDMGSSLGLWFGLSVFGITDLIFTVFQYAKKFNGQMKRKHKKANNRTF